jgi:hypothetical protein
VLMNHVRDHLAALACLKPRQLKRECPPAASAAAAAGCGPIASVFRWLEPWRDGWDAEAD